MPVLDVGVLRTWQYPASVVHEHTWAAESAEKFGQLTDLLFLGHVDSDMEAPPREARVMIIPRPAAPPVTTAIPDAISRSQPAPARDPLPRCRSDAWL